jgi:hypothetical protein
MTNTNISVELIVNGQPFIFNVDATDGSQTELTNLVSGRSIGDTFSSGAVIQMARGSYCENYAQTKRHLSNLQTFLLMSIALLPTVPLRLLAQYGMGCTNVWSIS